MNDKQNVSDYLEAVVLHRKEFVFFIDLNTTEKKEWLKNFIKKITPHFYQFKSCWEYVAKKNGSNERFVQLIVNNKIETKINSKNEVTSYFFPFHKFVEHVCNSLLDETTQKDWLEWRFKIHNVLLIPSFLIDILFFLNPLTVNKIFPNNKCDFWKKMGHLDDSQKLQLSQTPSSAMQHILTQLVGFCQIAVKKEYISIASQKNNVVDLIQSNFFDNFGISLFVRMISEFYGEFIKNTDVDNDESMKNCVFVDDLANPSTVNIYYNCCRIAQKQGKIDFPSQFPELNAAFFKISQWFVKIDDTIKSLLPLKKITSTIVPYRCNNKNNQEILKYFDSLAESKDAVVFDNEIIENVKKGIAEGKEYVTILSDYRINGLDIMFNFTPWLLDNVYDKEKLYLNNPVAKTIHQMLTEGWTTTKNYLELNTGGVCIILPKSFCDEMTNGGVLFFLLSQPPPNFTGYPLLISRYLLKKFMFGNEMEFGWALATLYFIATGDKEKAFKLKSEINNKDVEYYRKYIPNFFQLVFGSDLDVGKLNSDYQKFDFVKIMANLIAYKFPVSVIKAKVFEDFYNIFLSKYGLSMSTRKFAYCLNHITDIKNKGCAQGEYGLPLMIVLLIHGIENKHIGVSQARDFISNFGGEEKHFSWNCKQINHLIIANSAKKIDATGKVCGDDGEQEIDANDKLKYDPLAIKSVFKFIFAFEVKMFELNLLDNVDFWESFFEKIPSFVDEQKYFSIFKMFNNPYTEDKNDEYLMPSLFSFYMMRLSDLTDPFAAEILTDEKNTDFNSLQRPFYGIDNRIINSAISARFDVTMNSVKTKTNKKIPPQINNLSPNLMDSSKLVDLSSGNSSGKFDLADIFNANDDYY